MLSAPSVAIPVPVTARCEIRLCRFSPRRPATQIVDSAASLRFLVALDCMASPVWVRRKNAVGAVRRNPCTRDGSF